MAATESTMLPLGTPAPAFELVEPRTGRRVSLADFGDAQAVLVAFICNHCPYVVHVRDGLVTLAREYAARGVATVAISSNDVERYPQDGPDRMAEEAARHAFPFPYLFDATQEVARAYRAACTPDFFLFDRERHLVYRGQFDDSRPGNGRPVTGTDLRAALDAVLSGRPVPAGQRPSLGCNIKWRPGGEPEWGR